MSEWTGKSGSPLLYAKASSGAVTIWHCWTEGAEVVVEWGQEDGSMQTKRFKCKPKNKGRANATTASEQAEKEAHAKFAKQLKKKYFLSKELHKDGRMHMHALLWAFGGKGGRVTRKQLEWLRR